MIRITWAIRLLKCERIRHLSTLLDSLIWLTLIVEKRSRKRIHPIRIVKVEGEIAVIVHIQRMHSAVCEVHIAVLTSVRIQVRSVMRILLLLLLLLLLLIKNSIIIIVSSSCIVVISTHTGIVIVIVFTGKGTSHVCIVVVVVGLFNWSGW